MSKVKVMIEIDESVYKSIKAGMRNRDDVEDIMEQIERSESVDQPKTLLDNVAEWDRAIEKRGYVN